jgi:hypothetical protein
VDIGDTVIYAGKRFVVRGVDPAGVDPRCIYLEHTTSGETISVSYEVERRTVRGSSVLRLVGDDSPERLPE